jgi:Uma2 family endonuclease
MTLATVARLQPGVRENACWSAYLALLDQIGNGRTRVNYDNGRLEIMPPPGPDHDGYKKAVARIIEFYADFCDIDLQGLGSTTLRREDLLKGLEPDECFFIASARKVYDVSNIDPANVPTPDLVLEIDVSRPSINRDTIYAAMGVPELWKYSKTCVTIFHLKHGKYVRVDKSLSFPDLPIEKINEVFQLASKKGQRTALKSFRAWLKQT